MSMRALTWAFAESLKHGPKSVLLCLAWHANANGEAWPGVPRIARETGLGERQVSRNLDVLIELRLIGRKRRHTQESRYRRRRLADVFILNLEPGVPDILSDNEATGVPDNLSGSAAQPNRHSDSSYPTSTRVVSDILSPHIREPSAEPRDSTQDSISDDEIRSSGSKKKEADKSKAKIAPISDGRTSTSPSAKAKAAASGTGRLTVEKTVMPADWPGVLLETEAINYWRSRHRHDLVDDLENQVALARAHHAANATKSADWRCSWRTWFRRAVTFNRAPPANRGNSSAFIDVAQELLEELDE